MKKAVVFTAAAALLTVTGAFPALADQNNTGCGLGTQVIPNADTVMAQVLVATTNGTFGNQTFGITSGTSNCVKPTEIVGNERLERFVAANMDELARDIAAGEGETLATVAELLDVPAAERRGFYSTAQANFSRIYPSASVASGEVIDNLIRVVSSS